MANLESVGSWGYRNLDSDPIQPYGSDESCSDLAMFVSRSAFRQQQPAAARGPFYRDGTNLLIAIEVP